MNETDGNARVVGDTLLTQNGYKNANLPQKGFNTLLVIKSNQSGVRLPLQSVSTTTKRQRGVAGINRADVKIAAQ